MKTQADKYWENKHLDYLTGNINNATGYETFKSGPRKGQPKTLKDRVLRFIIEGLKLERVDSCIAKPKFIGIIPNSFWFVGENGSVRAGKNISTSFSITDRIKIQMEKWEKENELCQK